MERKKYILITVLFGLLISCAPKQTEKVPQVSVNEILKTTTSWDGDQIVYPEGDPEITGVIMEAQEGFDTGFHCHPMPNVAYILEGEVEVELLNGTKKLFKKGDSFEEVIDTWHRGKVVKGPFNILVYYAGVVDLPIFIKPKTDDLENEECVE